MSVFEGSFTCPMEDRTEATGDAGGDIIFQVDEGLNTLADFRHRRKYCAQDGTAGRKEALSWRQRGRPGLESA